ncbi:hypothetical protein [Streptomyces sp. NPDC002088]|uniref:hypothetical protein n=1 Tax=Streptomyces TaxID=1883 RepID=UPI003326D21C
MGPNEGYLAELPGGSVARIDGAEHELARSSQRFGHVAEFVDKGIRFLLTGSLLTITALGAKWNFSQEVMYFLMGLTGLSVRFWFKKKRA